MTLLSNRPIDSLAIDEIVAAANVAKGSFFYHFADKQSFAREIAANVRAEVELEVARVNEGIVDPAQRVARGICQFVRFAFEFPDKARIIIREDRMSLNPAHPVNAGLHADIDLGVKSGRFSGIDPDAAVLSLVAVTSILVGKVVFDHLVASQARSLLCAMLLISFRGMGLVSDEAEALLRSTAGQIIQD